MLPKVSKNKQLLKRKVHLNQGKNSLEKEDPAISKDQIPGKPSRSFHCSIEEGEKEYSGRIRWAPLIHYPHYVIGTPGGKYYFFQ